MFKKIEIWILYLVILFSIIFAIAFGVLVRQEIEGITKKGNIDISFLTRPAAYIARIPERALKSLLSSDLVLNDIWTDRRFFWDQDGFDGIPNAKESYLLLSRYDGDKEEGIVELVDLTDFAVLHTWNPDINTFNDMVEQVDEYKYLHRDANNKRSTLGHPKLLEDGELLYLNQTMVKIDACSNLVFQNTHDAFHHSIETDIDGNIWVPSNIYPQSLPIEKVGRDIIEEGGFYDEGIVKLSPDGEILFEKDADLFIYSVGQGNSPDLQLAIEKAMMIAKAELADKLQGQINKRTDLYITEIGQDGNREVVSKIEETIVNIVRETMIQGYEQWEKAVYETPNGQYRVYIGLKTVSYTHLTLPTKA